MKFFKQKCLANSLWSVCVHIYVCVCVYTYISIPSYLFLFYILRQESRFAALAGQELNYVDQAGLELSEILLPLSLWSAGTENSSHHTQLSLSFDRLLQAICYMIFLCWKRFCFPLIWRERHSWLFVLFVARGHTTQCYSCGHFGVDVCQTSRRTDDRESVKGFNYITECFSSKSLWNGCKRVLQCEVSDCWPPSPTSLGTCARFPRLFLVALQFFLWSKRRENLTDSNSLNGVIYSFKACQDKLKEHLSENAARSLLCNCRYFV